ncbi:MAG: O-antigen ligase family protein [Acidobacteriota bacterium]
MIRRIYPCILAVLLTAIFFTNFDVYAYASEALPVPPLYWIGLFAALAVPYLLSNASMRIIRQSPLALWCFLFLLISCGWFLFEGAAPEDAWQELRLRVLSVVFLLVALLVLARKDAQLWARRSILIAVITAIGLNFYELFYPRTFSSVVGRSAGLYVNPNQAGVALVLGMIATVDLIPPRWRLAFALLVGAGVAVTVSRSAMAGWAIVMLIMMWTKQLKLRRSLAVGFGVTLIAVVTLAWQWDTVIFGLKDSNVLNVNVIGRLEGMNQGEAPDDSAFDRGEVAAIAFDLFADSPLIGNGVGASRRLLTISGGIQISSHNQYLNLMVDHGLLGCLILPGLVLMTVWQVRGDQRRRVLAFAGFVLFMGLFSHNIIDERFMLLIFSLFAAMAISEGRESVPAAAAMRSRRLSPLPQLATAIESR